MGGLVQRAFEHHLHDRMELFPDADSSHGCHIPAPPGMANGQVAQILKGLNEVQQLGLTAAKSFDLLEIENWEVWHEILCSLQTGQLGQSTVEVTAVLADGTQSAPFMSSSLLRAIAGSEHYELQNQVLGQVNFLKWTDERAVAEGFSYLDPLRPPGFYNRVRGESQTFSDQTDLRIQVGRSVWSR